MEDEKQTTLWELDSTDPQKAETLREGLREVKDPELGMNIIELGLVREAKVDEGELKIKMILTTPFCPYGPALLEMTREKAAETTSMETTVNIGMEMWDPSMMEDGTAGDWGLF
ncbi:MAG: iron-sulfur cluster assembly protein [Anaerolineales bacterium]|jgi:metal-sulfur cluster biosynthetic enzyme